MGETYYNVSSADVLGPYHVDLDGRIENTSAIWRDDSEQSHVPNGLLWLPYVALTLIMLLMLLASFINFHIKNRWKYYRRRQVGSLPEEYTYDPTNSKNRRMTMLYHRIDVGRMISSSLVQVIPNPIKSQVTKPLLDPSSADGPGCSSDYDPRQQRPLLHESRTKAVAEKFEFEDMTQIVA